MIDCEGRGRGGGRGAVLNVRIVCVKFPFLSLTELTGLGEGGMKTVYTVYRIFCERSGG